MSSTEVEDTLRRRQTDRVWAYVLLRLLVGMNFLGHGAIRLFHGDQAFAQEMAKRMADTPLPPALAYGFGAAVPFFELAIGLMLVCDVLSRIALPAALLFLSALTFGLALKQDWVTAGSLLLYGLVLAALQVFRAEYDCGWIALVRSSRKRI